MTRLLQSELFTHIPAANIQRIFTTMESVELQAGDVVVEQGTPGDFYYFIQTGRCEVTRKSGADAEPIRLAELKEGDSIYIFSDGFADQFGGKRGKKLMTGRFKKLILSMQMEPMEKQQELLEKAFGDWRGLHEQVDDVLVIGIKF